MENMIPWFQLVPETDAKEASLPKRFVRMEDICFSPIVPYSPEADDIGATYPEAQF